MHLIIIQDFKFIGPIFQCKKKLKLDISDNMHKIIATLNNYIYVIIVFWHKNVTFNLISCSVTNSTSISTISYVSIYHLPITIRTGTHNYEDVLWLYRSVPPFSLSPLCPRRSQILRRERKKIREERLEIRARVRVFLAQIRLIC